MESATVTGFRKASIIALVYLSALAQGLAVVSVPASASVLKAVLDDAQYGASFVPQMLTTIAGSLLASRLGPRALNAGVLASALFASGLAQVLLTLVPHGGFVYALAATSLLGFGFGLSAAALNALPGRLLPERAQSALVALHTLIAGGFAAGPALVSAAIASERWAVFPLGVAAFALSLAALVLLLMPNLGSVSETRSAAAVSDSTNTPRQAAVFLGIAVCYALAEGTFANWAVVYLREERALSAASAALALSTFWFALALGRLVVSALLVRISAVSIWRVLPVAMGLAFLALPLVRDATSSLLAFGFAGLACSAFFPLTVSLAAPSFRGGAARASALLTAALMVGVGLGSFAVGPLREGSSLAVLYRWSCVYPLLTWALCWCLPLRGGMTRALRVAADV